MKFKRQEEKISLAPIESWRRQQVNFCLFILFKNFFYFFDKAHYFELLL